MKTRLKKLKEIWKIFYTGIDSHGLMTQAAAIAFYMIFSLPGLLITTIAIAGFFLGEEQVQSGVSTQLESFFGDSAKNTINTVLGAVDFSKDNTIKTIIGIGILLFSATTVFITMQESLNRIWNVVATPKKGFLKLVIDRLISLGMVVSLGFIALVSLLFDTLLVIFFENAESFFGERTTFVMDSISNLSSFVIIFVVIMFIFKLLPDVKIKWKEVALSSLITTSLFVLGKFLIGVYIKNSSFTETYQATGSVIIFLVWVYYSTVVILFGAEITRTIQQYKGNPIRPSRGAKKIRIEKVEYEDYVNKINGDA